MISIVIEFFLFIVGYEIENHDRANDLKTKDC